MTAFAYWSIFGLTVFGLVVRSLILAYTKPREPGASLVGLVVQVWVLVALIVWLRP